MSPYQLRIPGAPTMPKPILLTAALLLALGSAPRAHADSITLLSSSGSTYVYGIVFSNASTTFNQNQTITITGLSGITSVSASNFASYLGYTSSNSGSITLTMAGSGTYAGGSTQTLYTVVAGSPLTNLGQYTIGESNLTESGSIAVTPEPSSLFLLASGALLFALRPLRARLHRLRGTAVAQG